MTVQRRWRRCKALLGTGLLLAFLLCFGVLAEGAFAAPATLVDAGFESGTDGASLAPAWTLSGAPQKAEYDSARAKNGSLSGWMQGPTHGRLRRCRERLDRRHGR